MPETEGSRPRGSDGCNGRTGNPAAGGRGVQDVWTHRRLGQQCRNGPLRPFRGHARRRLPAGHRNQPFWLHQWSPGGDAVFPPSGPRRSHQPFLHPGQNRNAGRQCLRGKQLRDLRLGRKPPPGTFGRPGHSREHNCCLICGHSLVSTRRELYKLRRQTRASARTPRARHRRHNPLRDRPETGGAGWDLEAPFPAGPFPESPQIAAISSTNGRRGYGRRTSVSPGRKPLRTNASNQFRQGALAGAKGETLEDDGPDRFHASCCWHSSVAPPKVRRKSGRGEKCQSF